MLHCRVMHRTYTRTAQFNDLQNVNLKSRTAQNRTINLYTSMVLSTMNPTLNGPKPFSPAPALIYACNDSIGYQQGGTILQWPMLVTIQAAKLICNPANQQTMKLKGEQIRDRLTHLAKMYTFARGASLVLPSL